MGFQSVQLRYRPLPTVVSVAPYYGMSANTIITEQLVLGLTGRGPTPGQIDAQFDLNAPPGSGLYMFFAYPASYGAARFLDLDSNFYGGWDGANDDPGNVFGPVLINVNIGGSQVPFYVYRTDYPELGSSRWQASKDF